MSLRNDRPLSQAYRYALHRRNLPTPEAREQSLAAWIGYIGQFTGDIRHRMTAVYYDTLHGVLVEDRRTRGRRD
jgi:hypothetical protein